MYPKYQIPCTFFGTKLKKEKKYVKMCKNRKYSKGTAFGVLAKNVKYVPENLAHLVYVPEVPDSWQRSGTKSSRPHFTLKSNFKGCIVTA